MLLELRGIERTFTVGSEAVHALREISFAVQAGEYISIMGPSGSGKSTLLNTIGLLDRPDRGRYLLAGQDTMDLDDEARARLRREQIGFVFQFFHLIPRLTARENIELPLLLAGTSAADRRRRSDRLLELLHLADRADHRPDQLSGGQRQRVAIARAVITRPSLLLADEPTGNLDQTSGHEVIAILEQLNRDGITLLLVTHDPDLGRPARPRPRMLDGRICADAVS